MLRILCLNGPNLDRLGTRDPAIYGTGTLADLEASVVRWGAELGCEVECRQSNSERELIEWIHGAAGMDGVVLNAGAFSHSSMAIADAVAATSTPMVEVHISHISSRERWRRTTHLASVAVRSISGRGLEGYRWAVAALVHHARRPARVVRYGPHPDHVVDVWTADRPRAGAVLVHGGFWEDPWGRDTVSGWGPALAEAAIDAVAIGYRRLGSGGGLPATLDDVAEALEVAFAHLPDDPVLIGHSAGAYLSAWAAASGTSRPVSVIGVGGIYDLRPETAANLGGGAVRAFAPEGDPSPLLMDPPAGAVALVHGTGDDRVPASQSVAYAEVLEAAHAEVTLDLVEGAGHFEVLDPRSAVWERVMRHMDATVRT